MMKTIKIHEAMYLKFSDKECLEWRRNSDIKSLYVKGN